MLAQTKAGFVGLRNRALATRALSLHHKIYPAKDGASVEPPLVVLHGLFGSASNFRTVAQRLASGRTVVLADLRNHGSSPWDSDVSFETAADDVAQLVTTLDAPVALCGHSLGGKVAMLTALKRPDLVSRLCVVDIAPVTYEMAGNRGIIEALLALPETALGSRADADAALAAAAAHAEPALGIPFVRQFLLQNLIPEQHAWRVNLRALLDGYDELRRFPDTGMRGQMPTLFIGGERGGMLEREHWPACQSMFPAGRLEMVPTGHWVHAEAPQRFFELLDAFCTQGRPL